jgi:hypothetical protein
MNSGLPISVGHVVNEGRRGGGLFQAHAIVLQVIKFINYIQGEF